MSFSDNESDNESVHTPVLSNENEKIYVDYTKINLNDINEYINSLKYKESIKVMAINKMDRYKIFSIMIGNKYKQYSLIIYDQTNITYSLHNDKMSNIEEEISYYAIEVCKRFHL
jgi:hypothetical protein